MKKRLQGYIVGLALAVLSTFGFSTLALAAPLATPHALRHSVAIVGEYGAQGAKLNAELAYMHGSQNGHSGACAMMTSESNGFRLAEMTKSGVAEGMTGVGAGKAQV